MLFAAGDSGSAVVLAVAGALFAGGSSITDIVEKQESGFASTQRIEWDWGK